MNTLLLNSLSFHVPGQLEACAVIREKVSEFARNLPFDESDLADIRLAVGEAASNAVKHGCRDIPNAVVFVNCWANESALNIEVQDFGKGFNPDQVREPDLGRLPEGGMGIYYMKCAMDDVEFCFDDGTKVILVKSFSR